MTRSRHRKAERLVAAVMAVGLVSCGSSGSSDSPVAVPVVPTDAGAAWFVNALPLGFAGQAVFDVHRALDNALARGISDCMQRLGFSYIHEGVKSSTVQFLRYGLLQGRSPGPYRPDGGGSDAAPGDSAAPAAPPTDPAYQRALYGTDEPRRSPIKDADGNVIGNTFSEGGCLGEATQKVAEGDYATFSSDDLIFQTAVNGETEALWADATVQSAMRPWQECMAASGAPKPEQLDFYVHYEWPEGSIDEQRRVATDELRCKEETGVVARVFAVDFRMQTKVLRRYPELIHRYHDYEAKFAKPS